MKKIYITRKIPSTGLKLLQEKGILFDMNIEKRPPSKKSIIRNLKKYPYDGVISFLTDPIDGEVFDSCPSAKVFANFAVGFNNIDIEEAEKRGIQVSNTPGTSDIAVAEHTAALMLALTTRLCEGDEFIRDGKYKGWDANLLLGTDMKGKVIGLIGVGAIGTKVAEILHHGFGSKIIYSDLKPNQKLEESIGAIKKETADLLKEADIVSLHVPLLPTTKHLINKETLKTMKRSAFLINTSRGPVVDEKALSEALKDDIIAGAGLDVFEFEPKIVKGLTKPPKIVLTPHIASSRISCRNMMSEVAVKNIISALETGKVINSVF